MQIDSMQPGEIWEVACHDKGGKEINIQFEILKVGWFPSPVKKTVYFHGAKCRFLEGGEEEVITFVTLEFARKVRHVKAQIRSS